MSGEQRARGMGAMLMDQDKNRGVLQYNSEALGTILCLHL